MSSVSDMNHFMAKKRKDLLHRPLFENTADADQLPAPVAGAPRSNHAVRPLTTKFRQSPLPVLVIQIVKKALEFVFLSAQNLG